MSDQPSPAVRVLLVRMLDAFDNDRADDFFSDLMLLGEIAVEMAKAEEKEAEEEAAKLS